MYNSYFVVVSSNSDLYHHGILGQKWGVRRFQDEAGKLTPAGRRRLRLYNNQHKDKVLLADRATLSTLSYYNNRTSDKNAGMFYAAYRFADKHTYNHLFNQKAQIDDMDSPARYKYRLDNKLVKNIKVAGEESGAKAFANLYKKNEGFRNFVSSDKDGGLGSAIPPVAYFNPKYKDAYNSLTKIQSNKSVTDADLRKTYRLYNLSMTGNAMKFGDFDNLRTQNKKYFKYLKSKGYGGLIDTNDGIYGGLQTKSPVMVFDMDSIIPKKTKQMKTGDKVFSSFVYLGKKLFE